jgi:hypothetical protein
MQSSDQDLWPLLVAVQDSPHGEVLGDIWKAAEAAAIKPGTIRVWMTRGKVKPVFGERGQEVFHIPTVVAIAEAGRKNKPADPAANARGPHARRVALQVA